MFDIVLFKYQKQNVVEIVTENPYTLTRWSGDWKTCKLQLSRLLMKKVKVVRISSLYALLSCGNERYARMSLSGKAEDF